MSSPFVRPNRFRPKPAGSTALRHLRRRLHPVGSAGSNRLDSTATSTVQRSCPADRLARLDRLPMSILPRAGRGARNRTSVRVGTLCTTLATAVDKPRDLVDGRSAWVDKPAPSVDEPKIDQTTTSSGTTGNSTTTSCVFPLTTAPHRRIVHGVAHSIEQLRTAPPSAVSAGPGSSPRSPRKLDDKRIAAATAKRQNRWNGRST
jgi:hypothetical protein